MQRLLPPSHETQASAAPLQAYQYKLSRSKRELKKLQQKLDERRGAADVEPT
jgi:hypothetical protein